MNIPLARGKVDEESILNSEDDIAILAGDSEAVANQRVKDEELKKLQNLFKDCKFYLSREVPREILVFVIRYVYTVFLKLLTLPKLTSRSLFLYLSYV